MAKKRRKQTPKDLSGSLYQRNGRWWWNRTWCPSGRRISCGIRRRRRCVRRWGMNAPGRRWGHTNMSATAIYAERNQGLADEAAERFG